jgi:hypothetical protein
MIRWRRGLFRLWVVLSGVVVFWPPTEPDDWTVVDVHPITPPPSAEANLHDRFPPGYTVDKPKPTIDPQKHSFNPTELRTPRSSPWCRHCWRAP